ncbi:MAG: hypothetical protein LBI82_04470 [Dysgonamonadaceae bacterium]|jgi:endo-1,4-beta-xylanase|nr:hypothetical protein [Dysgonamonadaceae bacterium]
MNTNIFKLIAAIVAAWFAMATTTAQEAKTMYIMKGGRIMFETATSKIDSVIFYQPEELPVVITTMDELPEPETFERQAAPPDLLTMFNGAPVTTKEEWAMRREEIKGILQKYMYGMWRTGENVTYSFNANKTSMTVTVEKDGKSFDFNAAVNLPTGTAPEGGWPVAVVFILALPTNYYSYLVQQGYALITITSVESLKITSDNKSGLSTAGKTGGFWTLYPYDNNDWKNQTGTIMALAWGASKIMDALAGGADEALNINTEAAVITGASANDKYAPAATCTGAFDERFKVIMPVNAGFGGTTMGRYKSEGITYTLLPEFQGDPKTGSINLAAWTSSGVSTALATIQGGWFNTNFEKFTQYEQLPFDAHFITALSCMEDRYMFMVSGITSNSPLSPPGMWYNYESAKPAFDLMGLSDNIAIQYHLNNTYPEQVDLIKMNAYINKRVHDKDYDTSTFPSPWNTLLKDWTLEDLKSCIFATEANKESYEAGKAK